MTADLLAALAVFAFATSITPGPNNLMLLASGVNFGFRRTVPHMLGIGIGFGLMLLIVGLGLGRVFETYPLAYKALRYGGGLYMLWLAWKIARAGPVGEGGGGGRPIAFVEAALFQWANPKAWVMAVTAISTYTVASDYFGSLLAVAAVFAAINLPAVSVWTLFGSGLRRFLSDPAWLTIFNWTMAALLVASMIPILWT